MIWKKILLAIVILCLVPVWAYFCLATAAIVGFSNMLPALTIPMIFLIFIGGLFLLGSWFFKNRKIAKTAAFTILGATLIGVCACLTD